MSHYSALPSDMIQVSLKPSAGREHIAPPRICVLTLGSLGLQLCWSLILGSGTPYLDSINIPPSIITLIWLVGPLGGAFLQPYLGFSSDRTSSAWGRRKPFIGVGLIGATISLMSLALIRVLANRLYTWFGIGIVQPHTVTNIARCFSCFWICLLSISLQPLQVGLRALVVDTCPHSQQNEAASWSGRFSALGAVLAYALNAWAIRTYPERSFEVQCVLVAMSLCPTILPCLFFVHDKANQATDQRPSVMSVYSSMVASWTETSSRARSICVIQSAAWLGWFPFLYYNTRLVNYMTSFTSSVSADAGANTYLLFALVSLYFSIVFPWLGNSRSPSKSGPISSRLGLPSLWILSQSLFGILMLGTPFTTSPLLVSVLFAGAGISWAIGLWAPLAMFSTEIVKLQESSQEKSVVEALQHGESQAGVSMSLYNFALSAPQIVAAGICSTVFWLAEGPDLHGSIRLALMLGGCSSLVAAGLIGILLL